MKLSAEEKLRRKYLRIRRRWLDEQTPFMSVLEEVEEFYGDKKLSWNMTKKWEAEE